jgi:acetyl-CoA carboxylase alpha subunit
MKLHKAASKLNVKSICRHDLEEFSLLQELIKKYNGQVNEAIDILTAEFKARLEYQAGNISANTLLASKRYTKLRLNQILIDALVKANEAIN